MTFQLHVTVLIFIISVLGWKDNKCLRQELSRLGRTEGLAIGHHAGIMTATVFGERSGLGHTLPIPATIADSQFTKDGRGIIHHILEGSGFRVVLCDLKGTIQRDFPIIFDSRATAFSRDLTKRAYALTVTGGDVYCPGRSYTGIRVREGDRDEELDRGACRDRAEEERIWLDWDPTGRFLLYPLGGRVFVRDMTSGQVTTASEGREPSWSPDGRWIACQGPAEQLVVLAWPGLERLRPKVAVKVASGARWSPDSRYLLIGALERTVFGGPRLSILRISDGAITDAPATDSFPDEAGTEFRGWLYLPELAPRR